MTQDPSPGSSTPTHGAENSAGLGAIAQTGEDKRPRPVPPTDAVDDLAQPFPSYSALTSVNCPVSGPSGEHMAMIGVHSELASA